jgi:hypothetical protein
MELTPEERRRIYEEEKARIEAENRQPAEQIVKQPAEPADHREFFQAIAVIVIGVIVIGLVTLLATGVNDSSEAASARPAAQHSSVSSGTYTLGEAGAICAEELSDAARIYLAIRRGDREGALGMVARGAANYLAPGTSVRAYLAHEGFSRVEVMSGFQLGRRCWVPSGMLR